MNGLDERGVVRERLSRGGLLPLEERHEVVLLRIQMGALEPCQGIFEVAPDPFNRVQLWTVGRQEHEAYVGREGESLGRMGSTVVQEQEVEAVRERLGEGLHEELEALDIQIRQFQEEPLTRRGFHGPIDIEPLKHVRHHADGLHARGGEAPPADGEDAEAAFVWAEYPDRTGVRGGNRLAEMCMTGGLEGWDGLRLFWCGSGAALCAWLGSADAHSHTGFYI
jgi:hypothetical protein